MMPFNTLIEQSRNIEVFYNVTYDVYNAFKNASGDLNRLHLDSAFAISKGMQGCVMYGNILNAFVSHFVGMKLPTKDVMIIAQDICYHKPFYLNDEIRLDAEVDFYSEAVNTISYKLVFHRLLCNGKSEKIARGHVQIKLI